MKHRLFNLLATVSLAAFSVIIIFWVRSFFTSDHYGIGDFYSHREAWRLSSRAGEVRFEKSYVVSREVNAASKNHMSHFLGFSSVDIGPRPAGPGDYRRVKWIGVPFWILGLLTGGLLVAATASWVARHKHRRRAERGECLRCGYDLRASNDRCPECGEPIPSASVEQVIG